MYRIIILLLFFSNTFIALSQTYIQSDVTDDSAQVTIMYNGETGGRPNLDILFQDEFEFYFITPVCPGEFLWCLRIKDNINVASLKLEFNDDKSDLIISVKIDPNIEFIDNKSFVVEHLNLITGQYFRKSE